MRGGGTRSTLPQIGWQKDGSRHFGDEVTSELSPFQSQVVNGRECVLRVGDFAVGPTTSQV